LPKKGKTAVKIPRSFIFRSFQNERDYRFRNYGQKINLLNRSSAFTFIQLEN